MRTPPRNSRARTQTHSLREQRNSRIRPRRLLPGFWKRTATLRNLRGGFFSARAWECECVAQGEAFRFPNRRLLQGWRDRCAVWLSHQTHYRSDDCSIEHVCTQLSQAGGGSPVVIFFIRMVLHDQNRDQQHGYHAVETAKEQSR